MSIIQAAGSGEVSTGFYSTTIDQSLKFDDGSSTYLNRTPSSAGNRKTFTFSCWVKRSTFGEQAILDAYSDDSNRTRLMFDASNRFQFFTRLSGADHNIICNAVCRDSSAWYHVVFSVDTTQSTASNRVKIYINGESQTFTGTGFPDQNEDTFINHTVGHSIGSGNDSGGREIYFDGYLAEINMIDGTALDASSFGQTKNGIWIPKAYSGSYGTNGFHLPFSFTEGNSVEFDGVGDNISWSNATQYDIATDDDFCLEFFMKADIEANWAYGFGDYNNGAWVLQLGPSGVVYFYFSGGDSNFGDMSAHITTTDWHHIAYVRDSGTHRFYVDGVQRGTSTSGGTAAANMAHFDVGDANTGAGGAAFKGTLSNLRFTIGAARYGSGTTFTVPSSTLTNDSSNVKLLAFTTSTITADASTAAVSGSITVGNPVFSPDNPFSVTLGNDTSGNNNDFTSSVLVYSDVVPDSPTNNFATFNALEKHSATALSEGNLVSTSANANDWECTGSTMHVSSGKWYCEVLMTGATGTLDLIIGVARSQSFKFLAGTTFYTPSSNFGYYASVGDVYSGGSLTGDFNVTYGVGDIIGIAIDMDNLAVYFAKNNTYINSGNPASGSSKTGLSGALLAGASYQVAVGAYQNNVKFAVNFGQDSSFSLHTNGGSAFASDANGIGDFFYAPPSGYLAMCTSNLPDATIIDGTDHFNTVLWTGTGSGGTRAISGVGFSPDWVWAKNLTEAYSHTLYDSVRGAGNDKELQSNDTAAEGDGNNNQYGYLSAFDSDGFTSTSGSEGDANNLYFNESSKNYAAWNWLAGTAFSASVGSISTGPDVPSLASSGQVNTKAGFSIVSYSGSNSAATFAHGLSSAPELVIIKQRNNASFWATGFAVPDWTWSSDYIQLQDDAQKGADGGSTIFTAAPSSTVVSIGGGSVTSTSGKNLIAYCFHSVEGYSKIGQYEGNNSADGTFVYTGFRPAFLLVKNLDAEVQWLLLDNKRDPYNVGANYTSPDIPSAFSAVSGGFYDLLSNGFKWRLGSDQLGSANANYTYVYYAVAEQPFKFSNAR